MKYIFMLILLLTSLECSNTKEEPIPIEYEYQYNAEEINLMEITNQYRVYLGLNQLTPIKHIGYLCEQHNYYMIEKDTMSHDYAYQRQVNLEKLYHASEIGEIIAFNYQNNQSVLSAWINSPDHVKILKRSSYTNFGVSIKQNSNNRKFYTFIFIKK